MDAVFGVGGEMRFGICNELFEGWSWMRVCGFAADLGYDSVELAPFTVTNDVRDFPAGERERMRTEAAEAGVAIAGIHWLLVSPPGMQILSADPAVCRAAQEYLIALADFCGDLGAPVMVLGSPKQRRRPEGMASIDALKLFVEVLRPVADAAASRGVTICLEPLPASDTNFMNTLEDAAEVAAAMSHPGVALILDMRSMGLEVTAVPTLIRRYAPLARHVHANDVNLRGPGDGPTDLLPVFRSLLESGYDGTVSVEVFDFTPSSEIIARQSLAAMREALMAAIGT